MRTSSHERIEQEIAEIRRSFISQVKSGNKKISISMPHALYLTDSQSMLFEAATAKSEQYKKKLDDPISRLVELVSRRTILPDVKKRAHFIDLGPGYPSKSLSIIDALTEQGTSVTYYAIDISPFFLDRAVAAAHQRNLVAHSLHRRFEEIEPILDAKLAPMVPRIIFIGLTYCNFEPDTICKILSSITRKSDYCILCSQSSENVGKNTVLAPYLTDSVKRFSFEILKNIGISEDQVEYTPQFVQDNIDISFTTKSAFELLGETVPKGCKISTAKSYRVKSEDTLETLKKYFSITDKETDQESGVSIFVLQGMQE